MKSFFLDNLLSYNFVFILQFQGFFVKLTEFLDFRINSFRSCYFHINSMKSSDRSVDCNRDCEIVFTKKTTYLLSAIFLISRQNSNFVLKYNSQLTYAVGSQRPSRELISRRSTFMGLVWRIVLSSPVFKPFTIALFHNFFQSPSSLREPKQQQSGDNPLINASAMFCYVIFRHRKKNISFFSSRPLVSSSRFPR